MWWSTHQSLSEWYSPALQGDRTALAIIAQISAQKKTQALDDQAKIKLLKTLQKEIKCRVDLINFDTAIATGALLMLQQENENWVASKQKEISATQEGNIRAAHCNGRKIAHELFG